MILLSVTGFDDLLRSLVIMLLTVLLVGILLKKLNQPYFIAYIFAGILLGPYGFKVFDQIDTITAIGEFGLIIQMFFIGTEIELKTLAHHIRKPLLGVLAQLLLSFLFILFLGLLRSWNFSNILLFTFIISLSSDAIILEYLHKNKELTTPLGSLTTGILVLQDFLFVPMLLIINLMAKGQQNIFQLISLIIVDVCVILFLREVVLKKKINLPFPDRLNNDHELQVFTGLLICFGFAWITSLLHLSAAMGALIGGILISQSSSMKWLECSLAPFRVFFLSLFFLSIGLQINLDFLLKHAGLVMLVVSIILTVNSIINAAVFKLLKENWRNSVYAGALLSQIGEFSLALCLVARNLKLVDDYWYQLTLSVISMTMLFTAVWINIIRAFIYRQPSHVRQVWQYLFCKDK